MIACIQRVTKASVAVNNIIKGAIQKGLYVLICIEKNDNEEKCVKMAEKICSLRIFENSDNKMSLSLQDINGSVLVISQFTLAADASKGTKPDFSGAEKPDKAKNLYDIFTNNLRKIIGADRVSTGVFGEHMNINSENDGPVTIIIKK